jgi:hypothetical protein
MCLAVHRGVASIVLACNPAYSIVFVTDDATAVLLQAAIQNLISLAKSTASGSSIDPSQETTAVDPLTAVTAPLPPSAPPVMIVSSAAEVESGEIVVTSSAAASSSSSAAASSSSSVTYLSLLSEEDAVDEAGEKLLLSEIGKFRTRQLQRDKEVEEQRKMKIKAKMMELKVTLPLTPSPLLPRNDCIC